MLNIQKTQDKLAIVIVGYNRLDSIVRLLNSLLNAEYYDMDVPLVISIDASNNEDLYTYARTFVWPFGEKHVIIHKKRLGLREHIFSCGDLTEYFKGIILLEDDIYVSAHFYKYALEACNYYDEDDKVACIALYSKNINESISMPFVPYKDKFDVYATQIVITWGECWTRHMWSQFKDWLKLNRDIDFSNLEIPNNVKLYSKAWSKFFYAYQVLTNKYTISPYESYTTNFSEVGEHAKKQLTRCQVPLVNSYRQCIFASVENLVKYDAFMNPVDLAGFVGIDGNNLNVDLSGYRGCLVNKRYLLSISLLPYKVVKSYGLSMKPIDANIRKNIDGKGIYLYDTDYKITGGKTERLPIQFIEYNLEVFTLYSIRRYYFYLITQKVKNKKLAFLNFLKKLHVLRVRFIGGRNEPQ